MPTTVGVRDVDLLLPPEYPFDRPRIGVENLPPHQLPCAHVESCDLLCLEEQGTRHEIATDERAIIRVLDRAAALLTRDAESLQLERRAEFINYWQIGASGEPFYSILEENTPFGTVSVWAGVAFTLVAPSDELAVMWLARRFDDRKKKWSLARGVYLPGDDVSDTISSAMHLPVLAAPYPRAFVELQQAAREWRLGTPVVFRRNDPFALVGGWIRRPIEAETIVHSARYPGFRKGREPLPMAMNKYFSSVSRFERSRLQRADSPWVLARGGEEFDKALLDGHVCLIGAGALGSGVLRLLAKAGVGHLTVVDPDVLTFDNIARHDLGADHVGEPKSVAMARQLMQAYPFVDVRSIPLRWQEALQTDAAIFDVDLVLSTTASWPAESQLNALFREQKRETTLAFGWLEAHAAAGQLLLVRPHGGCLACGMTAEGAFTSTATIWPDPQLRGEPACGNMYAPYSDLNAGRVRLSIAQHVIQALKHPPEKSRLVTLLLERSAWEPLGGTLNETVRARLGREPNPHGEHWTIDWPIRNDCDWCSA